MNNKTGVILMHGAGLGAYIWDEVKSGINVPTLAVEFPNRNSNTSNSKLSLDDYKNSIVQQIEQWGCEKLILVTHSISGTVGLKVARHFGDRVVGFVAISAAIPDNRDSYLSCFPSPVAVLMKLMMSLLGTKPPASAIAKTLCHDLTPQQSEKIVQNFKAESKRLYFDKCESPLPAAKRFYVKLEKDEAFSVELQNKSIKNLNTQQVASLPTGHLPMMSHPKELADVLNKMIDACIV